MPPPPKSPVRKFGSGSTALKGVLDDGRKVNVELFRQIVAEELPKVREIVGDEAFETGTYEQAR